MAFVDYREEDVISLLCPTRKRPAQLKRMVESALSTATTAPEIVCYVDNDDDSYDVGFESVYFVRGPRIVVTNCWNKCAGVANGEIFCQANDDIIFRTRGWDQMVETEFSKVPDRILMVHGSDGSDKSHESSNGQFGVHPFVHRRWFETLGYFIVPFFSSDYGDTWVNDLANAIGRRHYLPFIIEHMHYLFGKAEMDENTRERLQRHSRDNVEQLYRDLLPLREIDIDKLKAAMR